MIKLARFVFLLLVSLVALSYLTTSNNMTSLVIMVSGVVLAFVLITADILIKRKNLSVLSGVMFGLLVGILLSLGLSYLLEQAVQLFFGTQILNEYGPLVDCSKLLLALMICYVTVSFILQTKDDFRFIIPYVEFQRATKGPRPIILDTSVIIDGRIADMAATGVFETTLIVPRFVLNAQQANADSSGPPPAARAAAAASMSLKNSNPFHGWNFVFGMAPSLTREVTIPQTEAEAEWIRNWSCSPSRKRGGS